VRLPAPLNNLRAQRVAAPPLIPTLLRPRFARGYGGQARKFAMSALPNICSIALIKQYKKLCFFTRSVSHSSVHGCVCITPGLPNYALAAICGQPWSKATRAGWALRVVERKENGTPQRIFTFFEHNEINNSGL
jgi:hypothetical protein